MIYWSTANLLLRNLYPHWRWAIPVAEKKIYLSFDDGPHPEITPLVLQHLAACKAKASFFCIGDNVQKYPQVYAKILSEGHTVGNHTMHHVNGWKTSTSAYLDEIESASRLIDSRLFRPPYGKMTRFQGKLLREAGWEVVMWSVLSADFDRSKTPSACWEIVQQATRPGSIIVFHDSEKAWPRLSVILPQTLEFFSRQGYTFEQLTMNSWASNK